MKMIAKTNTLLIMMFEILQRAKRAPELPLAVRECMHNMQVGSVPVSTAQNLCSTDGSTYMTPTSENDRMGLYGYD
ncbi:hypothetical protein GUITHDRAFT_105865 [Guillardia theta CCMP2712]|uniref:Uncharacterized protein n=1 Tax=Guillardia theta (strain CCMP2712) TaxID=905079 RepID=L1JJJ7_GUITC|nr:hypothetical protein GUITHDRAFT_105865 [Guillardia theta CCMP2712]EKX48260.1 hypothetical protein GUITHDRAFT_105865 [Guillardia theta CCMP2712]|eukprot:XP_005835240.1 hypothetical protein GUITHDRAFT_105865 [Guillardia theta CCMP2712]